MTNTDASLGSELPPKRKADDWQCPYLAAQFGGYWRCIPHRHINWWQRIIISIGGAILPSLPFFYTALAQIGKKGWSAPFGIAGFSVLHGGSE